MAELLASFMTAEPPTALAIYQQCFLNKDVVTVLLEQPQEIPKFIARGAGLVLSYTTTLCAVRVKKLTNISYVAPAAKEYNDAFLYSIALAGQVDPGQVVLGDRQGEVAFALCDVWSAAAGRPLLSAEPRTTAEVPQPAAEGVPGAAMLLDAETRAQAATAESEEDEEEGAPLEWEPQLCRRTCSRYCNGTPLACCNLMHVS